MGSDVPLSVLEAFVEIENTYVDVLIYVFKKRGGGERKEKFLLT